MKRSSLRWHSAAQLRLTAAVRVDAGAADGSLRVRRAARRDSVARRRQPRALLPPRRPLRRRQPDRAADAAGEGARRPEPAQVLHVERGRRLGRRRRRALGRQVEQMPDVVRRQEGEPAGDADVAGGQPQRHRDRAAARAAHLRQPVPKREGCLRPLRLVRPLRVRRVRSGRVSDAARLTRAAPWLTSRSSLSAGTSRRSTARARRTRRTSARSPPPASSTGTRAPSRSRRRSPTRTSTCGGTSRCSSSTRRRC